MPADAAFTLSLFFVATPCLCITCRDHYIIRCMRAAGRQSNEHIAGAARLRLPFVALPKRHTCALRMCSIHGHGHKGATDSCIRHGPPTRAYESHSDNDNECVYFHFAHKSRGWRELRPSSSRESPLAELFWVTAELFLTRAKNAYTDFYCKQFAFCR